MAYSADTFVADEQPTTAKWNKLWSNDASFNDGTGIGDNTIDSRHYIDGSIDPEHLISGAGSSWAWQSWTPTWGNLTAGNGTNSSKYIRVGNTILARLAFVFGSTSSIAGNVTFSLPITSVAYTEASNMGQGTLRDAGTAEYKALVSYATTTTATLYVLGSAGSYANASALSSTVPMTWTTNDHLSALMVYEAA